MCSFLSLCRAIENTGSAFAPTGSTPPSPAMIIIPVGSLGPMTKGGFITPNGPVTVLRWPDNPSPTLPPHAPTPARRAGTHSPRRGKCLPHQHDKDKRCKVWGACDKAKHCQKKGIRLLCPCLCGVV